MPSSHRDAHPYGRSTQTVRRREERASRQRRVRITQLVVFSLLTIVLIGALVWAAANLLGEDPAPAGEPSDAGGAVAAAADGTVCPEPGAVPTAPGEVSVSVRNGTSRSGLAATTTKALAERGYATGEAGNTTAASGPVTIVHGPTGYLAAQSVAAQFEGATLSLDDREDASVTVLLGEGYTDLRDGAAAQAQLAQPAPALESCPAG